jgi:glucose uptake protein GlcU
MVALNGWVITWDILMFFAILLLVLALVPPIFSRRVVRRKTWHTLLLSSLVYSIGEVLLVGNQQDSVADSVANSNLCLVQVAITYSTPAMWVLFQWGLELRVLMACVGLRLLHLVTLLTLVHFLYTASPKY